MIHNPFNNPKFSLSMVVFFLLITTIFYNTAFQISRNISENLAAISVSKTKVAPQITERECRSLVNSLSSTHTVSSVSTSARKKLEECARANILRGTVSAPNYNRGASSSSCPADITNNGVVDQFDMDAVVANWGAMGGPADVNGSGVVNVDDLLIVIASWGPCPGQIIPTSGLIGWYHLDTDASDSSGLNNSGTANSVTYVTGHTNNAGDFSGINSYITASSLNNDVNTNAGTVAFWTRRDFANNTTVWPTHIGIGKDANNLVEIYYNPQVDMFVFHHLGNGTEVKTQASSDTLPQGEWHHVAMTWDTIANQMKVFIDGTQFGNTKTGLVGWTGGANDSFIGKSMTGPDYFDGALDEVLVYNRALSNTEIQSIFSGGSTPPPPPPGATCGNGIIEGTEQCDGANLGGNSCTSPAVGGGFTGGTLSCNPNTCTFNTTMCTSAPTTLPEITVAWLNGTTYTNINDEQTSPLINFGSVTQNTTAPTRTFRITNTGTSNLTVGSVTVPTGYTVTSQPTSPIAPNGNATFVVRMNTGTQGTFPGQISFSNNDSNENPFNFSITGAVTGGQQTAGAEIGLSWNSPTGYVNIADGQTNPKIDFGTVVQGQTGPTVRFRIRNEAPTGAANLTFGTPTVPAGYTITTSATSPVTPGNYSDFIVRLDSVTAGTKNGQITIPNTNDSDETTYNFEITGIVTSSGSSGGPCIQIGGGNSIAYQNCTSSGGFSFDPVNLNLSLSNVNINTNSYGIYCNTCVTTNLFNTHIYTVGGPNQYAVRGNFNQWTSSNSSFENDGQKGVFRVYGLTNGSSYNDTFHVGRMFLGGGYSVESVAPYGPFQNFLFEGTNIDVQYIDIYPNSNNIRFKNVDFHNTDHITIWDGAHHIWFENVSNLPRLRIGSTDYNNPCSLPSSLSGPPWYVSIVGTCN